MATKRVLVTGASSGIGAATATRLAQDGWRVVAAARRLNLLQDLATQHPGIEPFPLDVTDDASVAALGTHLAQTGGLGALVNNAGGAFGLDPVATGEVADWRHMYEINVLGALRVIQMALPLLRASALGSSAQHPTNTASIVVITSTAAHAPYPGGAGYVGAKHAERVLASTLRLELAGEPIRVSQIEPGAVETAEFSLNRFGGDQARAAAVGREGYEPLVADDVAEAVAWTLARPSRVNIDHLMLRPLAQVSNTQTVRDAG